MSLRKRMGFTLLALKQTVRIVSTKWAPNREIGDRQEMKAQIMTASKGLSRPTGWHHHECDSQFVYVLKGWVDLEFETGEKIRVEAGHSLFIPGGLRHNETATAEELEILEVCTPAEMGTVPCDPPAGMA